MSRCYVYETEVIFRTNLGQIIGIIYFTDFDLKGMDFVLTFLINYMVHYGLGNDIF